MKIRDYLCTLKQWKRYWKDADLANIISQYQRLTKIGHKYYGSLQWPLEFNNLMFPEFEINDIEGNLSVGNQLVDYEDIGKFIELLDSDEKERRYWDVVFRSSDVDIRDYAFAFVLEDGTTVEITRKGE